MITVLAAGFLLGLSVAAPIGAVGTAVIREGLERGARAAFLIGLGAACVDFVYLTLVYLGVAPLLLQYPWLMSGFYLLGGLLLGQMAYGSFRRAWTGGLPVPSQRRAGGFLFGLGITLFNPAAIISWLGLGGAYASDYLVGRPWGEVALALLAVAGGSAAWFGALSLLVGWGRHLAGERPWVFRSVNLGAGLVLTGFSVFFLSRLFTG
ncbi:MAG: LysE/ArgO family amino acid transporter [Bacillota bacterium]